MARAVVGMACEQWLDEAPIAYGLRHEPGTLSIKQARSDGESSASSCQHRRAKPHREFFDGRCARKESGRTAGKYHLDIRDADERKYASEVARLVIGSGGRQTLIVDAARSDNDLAGLANDKSFAIGWPGMGDSWANDEVYPDKNALASSNRRPAGVCSSESRDVPAVCVSRRAKPRSRNGCEESSR
jgi:hypothetical protein